MVIWPRITRRPPAYRVMTSEAPTSRNISGQSSDCILATARFFRR